MSELLKVNHLVTQFYTDDGIVKAVDDVSFHVNKGETVGLVGESGCGKSVTALSIMGLHSGKIAQGEILLEERDLTKLSREEMRKVRGNEISMIFQDPMSSLDPVFTVGFQMREALKIHQGITNKKEADERIVELLHMVGIPQPEARINSYPHQLSGGMCQRVMIAMAISCNSKLLIADEPTTALDVTIQAQILELMQKIKEETGMSILLITHDMGVVAEMCDRVMVMYCGKLVESADAKRLFQNPQHRYTRGLLSAIPSLDKDEDRLNVIPGTVPSLLQLPEGCRFGPRCGERCEQCKVQPDLALCEPGHMVACCRANGYPAKS